MSCLIGSSGFVGSALQRYNKFEYCFNRKNISDSEGRNFDTVICAAAPGSMFYANLHPNQDTESIDSLILNLTRLNASRFVLVSTIAVFSDLGNGHNELYKPITPKDTYGMNRLRLENFCRNNFSNFLLIRLPALFGEGLKKNFIFDILNPMPSMLTQYHYESITSCLSSRLRSKLNFFYKYNENVEMYFICRKSLLQTGLKSEFEMEVTAKGLSALSFTSEKSKFQCYNLENLWKDINKSLSVDLKIIHLSPEPILASDIYFSVTGKKMISTNAKVRYEDFRTIHSNLWGIEQNYIASKRKVLKDLNAFYEKQSMSKL